MNENTKHYLFVGVTVMFIIAFAYCISGGKDVQRNGDAVDSVGNKIEQAGDKQREISSGLQGAESTAGSVAGSIGRSKEEIRAAQDAAGRIDATIQEQRVLIGECQQIIAGIRRAGEADADKD